MSYIDQVIGAGADGMRFVFLRGALSTSDADLVHIQDPVSFLGPRAATSQARVDAARAVVDELTRRELPLVQTLHGPHQGGTSAWRRILDDATALFVTLDGTTFTPDPARTVVIPHAHYLERFIGYPRAEQIPGRILAISPNRLVRSAPDTLEAFPLMNTTGVSLRLVGQRHRALDEHLGKVLSRNPSTISAQIGLASDAMMINEISAAEVVILPDNKTLVDESMQFLALSLERPILAPDSTAMSRLDDEVGAGWIYTHPAPLTARRLDEVMQTIHSADRAERPDLSRRGPATTAQQYADAFRSVIAGG